jgi:uncharacterized glyoxalase superfamily protein PhnB
MTLRRTTPILRIFDEALARAYYLDYLGFSIVFEHRFAPDMPLYLSVVRGECTLHLSGHHGDASPGASLRIEVTDLPALQAELAQKRFQRLPAPQIEEMPWGTQDMRLTDPFGNRLTLSNAISV